MGTLPVLRAQHRRPAAVPGEMLPTPAADLGSPGHAKQHTIAVPCSHAAGTRGRFTPLRATSRHRCCSWFLIECSHLTHKGWRRLLLLF